MKNYNFEIFSPYEFEMLSRDLLQNHLGIFLESFGEGQDGGIDLRCSQGEYVVVQAKRYKDFSSLFSNLKKEQLKVVMLNPERYILTISSSLTPANKEKIKKLFDPYIKSVKDIFGKEDLNNLLTKFPEVEMNFHKLWLSSVDVLNKIFNRQIINQSKFLLDDIKEKIQVYVENDSFKEARSIIRSSNYVIISGPPGIGKTTLAEMLVFHLLSKNMEEFIFLSDSIDDGYKFYDDNKRQVFLFDDFLGRNFLQNTLPTNEEKQILRFINIVQSSSNKVLIFTTREYILNQAKQKFDVFEEDFFKCILDISKYSTLVKAKILYNHLSINKIPFEYIDEIIKQNYLFKIINHRNYNPRIIETFSKRQFWTIYKHSDFPSRLIELFDSPFSIWKHVYENQISERSQIVLACLLISGVNIEYKQLYKQVQTYLERNPLAYNISFSGHNFKVSLKELENSMIQINKKYRDILTIDYKNPSVQDFLVGYINTDPILKKQLFKSILFLKPSFQMFTIKEEEIFKVKLDLKEIDDLQVTILSNFDNLKIDSGVFSYFSLSEEDIIIIKLSYVNEFIKNKNIKTINFIREKFMSICYSENITSRSITEFTSLLCLFSQDKSLDIKRILLNLSVNTWDYECLNELYRIKSHFPERFEQFRNNEEVAFNEIFNDIISSLSISDIDDINEINSHLEHLKSLEYDYGHDLSAEIEQVESKIEELHHLEYYYKYEYDEFPDAHYPQRVSYIDGPLSSYIEEQEAIELRDRMRVQKPINEKELIRNMFKSLK